MDVIKDWIVKNVAEFAGRPHVHGSNFHERVVAVLKERPEYIRNIFRWRHLWIHRPAEESGSSDSNSDVPLMSIAEIRAAHQRELAAANAGGGERRRRADARAERRRRAEQQL